MLNLRNVSVLQLEDREDSYVIHAESVVVIRGCPECRSADSVVISKRVQRYVDTQMHAKTVKLINLANNMSNVNGWDELVEMIAKHSESDK